MDDYISHHERMARERDAQVRLRAGSELAHERAMKAVTSRLAELSDDDANCYLEILEPAGALQRALNRRNVVYVGRGGGESLGLGLRGRPFVIGEVLRGYRVPAGLRRALHKDGHSFEGADAFVARDGRVWMFSGSGATATTFQLRAANAMRLEQLATADLERIADGLPV